MPDKLDYKKEYKDLYMPKKKPMLIEVPPMNFIMVNGQGEPGGETYKAAMDVLYSLTFTIKMSKMSGTEPDGYFEYVVPPLEGLWWGESGALNVAEPRETWCWTSMIRQPEFVTPDVYDFALATCKKKKPEVDYSKARFETFAEGLCVQMMHVGSYDEETDSLDKLAAFIEEQQLENLIDVDPYQYKHHEIYISYRSKPENLKTVLRLPVRKR